MIRLVYQTKALDALRSIGDDGLDGIDSVKLLDAEAYFKAARGDLTVAFDDADNSFHEVAEAVRSAVSSEGDEWLQQVEDVYGLSRDDASQRVARARRLFVRYSEEISAALLLAALPELYACEWGAVVLVAGGELVTHLQHRITQTARFIKAILGTGAGVDPQRMPSPFDPRGRLVTQCAALRLFHYALRQRLARRPELGTRNTGRYKPLNVEDLLGALLTFSVTTFRVLKQLGVVWTAEDQDAYLFFWDLVGAYLGVNASETRELRRPDGWITIRPPTVGEAGTLLGQLHARQWLPVQQGINKGNGFQWDRLVPGRQLTRALLDSLIASMPATRRSWPAIVMRELAPVQVRDRLALHRTGIANQVADTVAWDSFPNLPGVRTARRARTTMLRAMACEVAGRAMVDFLREEPASLVTR